MSRIQVDDGGALSVSDDDARAVADKLRSIADAGGTGVIEYKAGGTTYTHWITPNSSVHIQLDDDYDVQRSIG